MYARTKYRNRKARCKALRIHPAPASSKLAGIGKSSEARACSSKSSGRLLLSYSVGLPSISDPYFKRPAFRVASRLATVAAANRIRFSRFHPLGGLPPRNIAGDRNRTSAAAQRCQERSSSLRCFIAFPCRRSRLRTGRTKHCGASSKVRLAPNTTATELCRRDTGAASADLVPRCGAVPCRLKFWRKGPSPPVIPRRPPFRGEIAYRRWTRR